MRKYGVYVPLAGYVYKEVEAENKQDAIDKVFKEGYEESDIVETDIYEKIVEGNICYVNTTEAYAEEIGDIFDDEDVCEHSEEGICKHFLSEGELNCNGTDEEKSKCMCHTELE